MAKKNQVALIIVIVLAFFTFNLAFPKYINQGIDFLNSKSFLRLPKFPEVAFKLGLDLQGGTHLVYQADLSKIEKKERKEAMQGLRDIIERRVNLFGVVEPKVQIQEGKEFDRLIVELPGVKEVEEAIQMIGKTPYLEFREEIKEEPYFKPTKLTGRYLKKALLSFNQTTFEPQVLLEFNSEGSRIFKELTEKNVGKRLAIYIDDVLISAPVVREPISGGKAQITGRFSVDEAKELVRNLNAGALPVPIKLISQNTVGPILGKISLEKSLKAGIIGFLAVILFMIAFYRIPGFFASLSLIIYAFILLSLFKLVPVTLTLAGIGGAILSVGMAVDANVLIFERMKEERKKGESFQKTLEIGFSRAWPSIRDSNLTTLIVALIMFSFGTSFIKGFAVTLSFGILVSMFSALFITRTFLQSFVGTRLEKIKWLWG
ncbi:protein translocase subunit SecD [bacterium]|nr:protein translocase subunit SecD [bacterium]